MHATRYHAPVTPICTIRRARVDDLPDVVRMLSDDALREKSEHVGPPLAPEYLAAFASMERDPNNSLMVAELLGRVVGTFQLTIIQHLMYRGGLVAQIEAVRIDRPLRRRGIGEQMMRWAIDEARRRRCARVQLTTNKQRLEAHRFYARLGFVATHEGMKLYLG
jgi:GNAT superfamily N-acetyltransferase